MGKFQYQHGFSEMHSEEMFDIKDREQKANKMLSVLDDYYSGNLETLEALDVGSSTGIMDNLISKRFKRFVGVDIDTSAIEYANKTYKSDKLSFFIQDSMNLAFRNESFDLVICSQVYEHVPDAKRMISEIYRVLKPEGICFFFAANRMNLIEAHYNLPFLSIMPKFMAHLYMRLTWKGKHYYETHYFLWQLRKLVSKFDIVDYTVKVLEEPEKFFLSNKLKKGSLKQRMILSFLKSAYWLCPAYIWLLRKNKA